MKLLLFAGLITLSCSNKQSQPVQSMSTVDSSIIAVGDSTPAILHIDTIAGSDTAFDVAMDSAGRTITAKDTSGLNKK